MPLSTKLQADYIELVNQSLDVLPFDSLGDFKVVQAALKHILKSKRLHELPLKYKERIDAIYEFLNEPELFVLELASHDEFKNLVKDRIRHKIEEIKTLSDEQKQEKIQSQQAHKEQVAEAHQMMSERREQAVVSVLSEEGWLRQEQELQIASDLDVEPELLATLSHDAFLQLISPEMRRALIDGFFTIYDVVDLNTEATAEGLPEGLFKYLNRSRVIEYLLEEHFTVEDMVLINADAEEAGINSQFISYLNTPDILQAIKNNEFTTQALVRVYNHRALNEVHNELIEELNAPIILRAIINHHIKLDSFIRVKNLTHTVHMSRAAKAYMNEVSCIHALSKGAYTVETLARVFDGLSNGLKTNLVKPHIVTALVQKEFTLESMIQTARDLNENGMNEEIKTELLQKSKFLKAIHDRLFTVADIAKETNNFIRKILHPNCLEALESGQVSIKKITKMSLETLNRANKENDYVHTSPNKRLRMGL